MSWSRVVEGFVPQVVNECRAGILVGSRLEISDDPEAALRVQRLPGVDLWIVDDLVGLASRQPIFAGLRVLQAFGLDGDHRTGIRPAELEASVAAATARMKEALPGLVQALDGPRPGPIGAHFVWSGPLCGGFLVKGVFRDEYREEDLWYDSDAPCRIYTASRGARQDPAEGGVLGVELFFTTYDGSGEPPLLTPELLASGDERLAAAGLLPEARIFVLPHYD